GGFMITWLAQSSAGKRLTRSLTHGFGVSLMTGGAKAKLKGLGRGLDALLGADEPTAPPNETLAMLAIDTLQPGRFQPRLSYDQSALAGLADSIKAQGVMQPILARPLGDGRYE